MVKCEFSSPHCCAPGRHYRNLVYKTVTFSICRILHDKNNDQSVHVLVPALAQCKRSADMILSMANIVSDTLLTMMNEKRIRVVLANVNIMAAEARQREKCEK